MFNLRLMFTILHVCQNKELEVTKSKKLFEQNCRKKWSAKFSRVVWNDWRSFWRKFVKTQLPVVNKQFFQKKIASNIQADKDRCLLIQNKGWARKFLNSFRPLTLNFVSSFSEMLKDVIFFPFKWPNMRWLSQYNLSQNSSSWKKMEEESKEIIQIKMVNLQMARKFEMTFISIENYLSQKKNQKMPSN